jgi:hypothetical protein
MTHDMTNPANQSSTSDDDITLHYYQDDLDTANSMKDPIMDEESDDPTKELGVDPKEFKKELDKYDVDDANSDDDDRREDIEALDMDDGDTTKY